MIKLKITPNIKDKKKVLLRNKVKDNAYIILFSFHFSSSSSNFGYKCKLTAIVFVKKEEKKSHGILVYVNTTP